ncbi:CapA family protein [Paenibacillus haidiansis]
MYPPRSEKYKKQKQEKQRRQSRFWLGLNLSLIFIIVVLGAYFYLSDRTMQGEPGTGNNDLPSSGAFEQDGNTAAGNDREGQGQVSMDSGAEDEDVAQIPADPGDASEVDPANAPADEEGTQNEEGVRDPADSGERLLIHFAGDTIFSGKVADKLRKEGYDYPYRYVKELFQNDDLSIVNLETPVTDGGTAAENKTFVFKSSPEALPELAKAGVEAVNLANNHTLDQGVEGLLDTMDHLKQNGLLYVGAGKNGKEAYAPVYIERKGIKIALCGFSRVIPDKSWAAGNNPGVAAAYDSRQAVKAVQTARKNADLVLVVAHWGKERTTKLEDHQTALAHEFIDAGADMVIGGHAHVLQGLEKYKGKWIAYGTGNFIFTKSTDASTWETAVFAAECTRKGDCELKLIPFKTELAQPVPMTKEEGAELLGTVEALSPGVSIEATGRVSAAAVKSMGSAEPPEPSEVSDNT